MSLTSAETSVPPLKWSDVMLMPFFMFFGTFFVFAIQAARKDQRPIRIAWHFFLCGGIYFFSTGVSSLILSLWRNSFGPPSLLFIAIAAGMFVGLKIMKPANGA